MTFSGGVHIGFECPHDGTRIGMYVGATEPTCPQCSRPMRAIEGANAPEVVTNFVCPHCNTAIGAIVSTGPITACPNCKKPID